MKLPPLPPYEEFIKLQNDSDLKVRDGFIQSVSKICLGYLEQYHNWLAKQLEGNTNSTEADMDTD